MSEADIWRLVRLAGVRDGHVIPQTPEEAEEAMRYFKPEQVELPPSLSVENITRRLPVPEERMMKWFAWEHLPPNLQAVSKPFGNLATMIVTAIEPGPERTVALRKLLEAKDAAVRAALNPGG